MAEDRILYTLPYGSKHLLRLYLVLIFGIQTPSEAKVNIHKDGANPWGNPWKVIYFHGGFSTIMLLYPGIYIYTDLDKNICCILATSKNIEEDLYLDFSQHVVGI